MWSQYVEENEVARKKWKDGVDKIRMNIGMWRKGGENHD